MRRAWWWIAAIGSILGIFLLWSLGRRRGSLPLEAAKREIQAIEAGRKAAADAALLGAERAKAAVDERHKAELAALDESQKEQADALASDPAALARFLIRAGSGKQKTSSI